MQGESDGTPVDRGGRFDGTLSRGRFLAGATAVAAASGPDRSPAWPEPRVGDGLR